MHRYKVWLLAKEQAAGATASIGSNSPSAAKQINKLSDLETLLLLYNYGRPMEMSAASKYTLPGGQPADCRTTKVSSESVDFVYNKNAPSDPEVPRGPMRLGSPVSLDIEEIGAFAGVLTAQNEEGFQVSVNRDSKSIVSTKLAHIAVKRGIGVEAISAMKTGVTRIEPKNKNCSFTDYTATLKKGMIVNLSQFDALIRTSAALIPPIGTRIVLRGPEWHGADVISTFEIGFMVKFTIPIPVEKFSPALVFTEP